MILRRILLALLILGGVAQAQSPGYGPTPPAGAGTGTGTVTSVAETFTGGLLSISGSPVTSAGTISWTVAGTSGGIPYFSGASTWASSTAPAANTIMLWGGAGAAPKGSTAILSNGTATLTLGLAGTATGNLGLSGTTSGTITIAPQATAGTYNFNLPTTAGSSGQALTSAGGGSSAMTWTTIAAAPTFAGGLTATGTNQGTALSITSTVNQFSTVAAGTGAVLTTVSNGTATVLINDGANALLVYPASGSNFTGLAANASVLIPAGGVANCYQLTSTTVSVR